MFGTQTFAQQAGDKARLASAHWQCCYLIDNMNAEVRSRHKNASNHHFKKEYEYVLEMHDELNQHGETTRDNLGNAPVYLTWYKGSPSVEFSAGRLFQATWDVIREEWADPFNEKLETMTFDRVMKLIELSAESTYD